MRSNSCISRQIFFQILYGVYLAKIYTSNVFGDAAPSILSFIGLKVIYWLVSGVRSAGHISLFYLGGYIVYCTCRRIHNGPGDTFALCGNRHF